MQVTLNCIAQKLKEIKYCYIYFHKKPDGDAIGSSHALALGLHALGIRCKLQCGDPIPEKYNSLRGKMFSLLDESWIQPDGSEKVVGISVDTSSRKRLGMFANEKIDFCIDHHANNSIDAEYSYIEANASSCSEIIYKLFCEMRMSLSKLMADFLYTGIITDTLCFRARSTTKATLSIAAEIAGCGADIVDIARYHCLEKTPERMAIEAILMKSFHYSCGNKILGGMFTYEDMTETGIKDTELEGINAVIEQAAGIDIGIVIRETKPGFCRVSVRTSDDFNAAHICEHFGGGGHANAAGGEINATPRTALKIVEKISADFLNGLYQ